MSRYIDADKLKEECYKFANDVSRSAMAFVQGQINAAPTADVVEVVRCKDCIFCKESKVTNRLYCDWHREHYETYPNDYCSYGERSENGT